MKKMLFGLLALSLSASVFAASDTATMQVEAKLEVVPATADLVIEQLTDAGAWNVVGAPITFDHGRVVKKETSVPTPVINENFRVRRADNTAIDTVANALEVRIGNSATAHTPAAVGSLTISGAVPDGETGTIPHEFRTIPAPAAVAEGQTAPVPFNIESRVDSLTGKEAVGVFRRLETVTVVLTAPSIP